MNQIKSKNFVYFVALIASLGGLLFGYDTAVISGTVTLFEKHFALSPAELGWGVSSALVGCVIGAAIAGTISKTYGRKKSILACAILFALGAIGTALPQTFFQLVLFRIVGGIGMGIASFVVPVYLAEISPRAQRGALGTFYQFAITFGICLTYVLNYFVQASSPDEVWLIATGWRWMFGLGVVPAIILCIMNFAMPESPRWLVQKNKNDECIRLLKKINQNDEIALNVFNEIKSDIQDNTGPIKGIFASGLGKVLLLACFIHIFSQATGINVVIYYATKLLNSIGTGDNSSVLGNVFFQNILIGLSVFFAVFVSLKYVEKVGRKPLMIWGCFFVAISLFIIGFAVYANATGIWVLGVILFFIFAFGSTLGPLPWIIISEISPNSHRTSIASIAVMFFWLTNIIVAQTFPMINDNEYLIEHFHGSFPFFMYGSITVVFLFVCIKFLPETKGKSLEEIGREIKKSL